MNKKIVLAYSGGLDTSILVHMLTAQGWDVIACHVDVGEDKDGARLKARAQAAGAVAVEIIDAKQAFVTEYCFVALQANAVYEGVYPLCAALSRPLIAKHLVATARKYGACAVAHGSTGKGNDQVRFDLAVHSLAPDLQVIAPQRQCNLTRDLALAYAATHGIEVAATVKSPYSVDENLWGRSVEGGALEDPAAAPPESAYAWTASWDESPAEPVSLTLGFVAGVPTHLNGEAIEPVALLGRLNELAGAHGVGRIDVMESRMVGIKSREIYECPAAVVLIAAHQELERFTALAASLRVKAGLDQRMAELIYEGAWFTPLRACIDAFNTAHNRHATGNITLKLGKGHVAVTGRSSPFGLYDHALSTYDSNDTFDHQAAEGYIAILGLPATGYSRVHGGVLP